MWTPIRFPKPECQIITIRDILLRKIFSFYVDASCYWQKLSQIPMTRRNRFSWHKHRGHKHNPLVSPCHMSYKQILHERWYVSTPLPLSNFQSTRTCKSSVTGHKSFCIHIPTKKYTYPPPACSILNRSYTHLTVRYKHELLRRSNSRFSLSPQSIAEIAT